MSDSSESVYSGLEDSGSDSDDDREEEQGSVDDDDDGDAVKAEPKQDEQVRLILLYCVVDETCVSAAPLMLHSAHRQWRGKQDKTMEK